MSKSRTVLLLAAGAVLIAMWWAQGGFGGSPGPDASPSSASSISGNGSSSRDPATGLPWISVGELPPEAEETLALIDAGGPFPYSADGIVFGNRERLLPTEDYGYYHEYTVPTPGSPDRGARRIVTGAGGELLWTDDHYQSFERIKR